MDGDLSVDYLGDGYYALFRDNGDRRIIECVAPRVTDIFRTVARRFGHDHPVEMSYTAHLIMRFWHFWGLATWDFWAFLHSRGDHRATRWLDE